jgi:hypothetical protein
VEVHQISSSDPTFVFGLNPATIATIGVTVSWLLAKWKDIEEIRKVRAETKKLGIESALKSFDDRIDAVIKEGIEKRTTELISNFTGDAGRKNELENHLIWAMRSLLARIERGMTIEIRVTPNEPDSVSSVSMGMDVSLQNIDRISRTLRFQPPPENPVLELPPAEPPKKGKTE